MEPRVVVVILNWNNAPDTIACLDSLRCLEYGNFHTLVIDNGSTDSSLSLLRAYSGIVVLETGKNLGYAEGNNVGIRRALEEDPEYILVLNNDTELRPDFLSQLVAEAETDPLIGVVGPKMYFFEPSDMVFAAGSMVDWTTGTLNQRGIWQRESIQGPLHAKQPEDVDICIRAREAGYRVRYTPKAVLFHKVSASLGQGSPRNTYYMTRNALLFFSTYLTGWKRWLTIARIVWRNVGHIAVWTVKPQYRRSARNKRDANILALRDALLNRFGEMGPDVEAVCRRN